MTKFDVLLLLVLFGATLFALYNFARGDLFLGLCGLTAVIFFAAANVIILLLEVRDWFEVK